MAALAGAALATPGALPALRVRPRGSTLTAAAAARLGPGEPPASPRRAPPAAALPPAVQAAVLANGPLAAGASPLSYEDQLARERLERQWQQQNQQPPAAPADGGDAAAAAVAAPPAAPAPAAGEAAAFDLDQVMGMLNDFSNLSAELDMAADEAEELTDLSVGGEGCGSEGSEGCAPGGQLLGVAATFAAPRACQPLLHRRCFSRMPPLPPRPPAGGGTAAASGADAQGG